jgi:hypothetical protein
MLETAASVGWKVKDAIVWFHGIGRLVPLTQRRGACPFRQSLLVIVVVGIVAGWLAGRVMEGGALG